MFEFKGTRMTKRRKKKREINIGNKWKKKRERERIEEKPKYIASCDLDVASA